MCFNSALLDLTRVDVRVVLLFLHFFHSKLFVTLPAIDRNAHSKYPLTKLTVSISCHFATSRSVFWSLTWFTIFSVTYDTRDKLIGYPVSDQECDRMVILFSSHSGLVTWWAYISDIQSMTGKTTLYSFDIGHLVTWSMMSSSNMFAVSKRLCSFHCFKVICRLPGHSLELRLFLLAESHFFYSLSHSHKNRSSYFILPSGGDYNSRSACLCISWWPEEYNFQEVSRRDTQTLTTPFKKEATVSTDGTPVCFLFYTLFTQAISNLSFIIVGFRATSKKRSKSGAQLDWSQATSAWQKNS